jgi:hypothetical protein
VRDRDRFSGIDQAAQRLTPGALTFKMCQCDDAKLSFPTDSYKPSVAHICREIAEWIGASDAPDLLHMGFSNGQGTPALPLLRDHARVHYTYEPLDQKGNPTEPPRQLIGTCEVR